MAAAVVAQTLVLLVVAGSFNCAGIFKNHILTNAPQSAIIALIKG